MGQYLLGGVIARVPYMAKELNIPLYTAEELCYYIYHNLSVLEDGFIQDDLVDFIRNEWKMTGLAERINRYYQSEKDRDMVLVMILRDVGYYNEMEISKFQDRISSLKRMNSQERKRVQADLFVKKGHYRKAICIYQEIIASTRDLKLGSRFYSRVCQHMAVCYAGLFQYFDAMASLKAAYREEKNREIQKQIYFLSRLQKQSVPKELQDVEEEQFQKWEAEFCRIEDQCRTQNNSIGSGDDILSEEEMSEYLEQKKQEYREMVAYVSV